MLVQAEHKHAWRAPTASEQWLVHNTPSRRDGISYEQELLYRQSCCQFILDISEGFRQTPAEPSVQLCVLSHTLPIVILQARFLSAGYTVVAGKLHVFHVSSWDRIRQFCSCITKVSH
jgi:hypothetical protein